MPRGWFVARFYRKMPGGWGIRPSKKLPKGGGGGGGGGWSALELTDTLH